jgi:hypothetical protein
LFIAVCAYYVCHLSRFCVSLVCGQQRELGDIAFQLTSHFDTSWVIRNSKLNKEWGVVEGTTTHKFPFKRLQPFKIEIFTSPSSYLVSHCPNNVVHQLIATCMSVLQWAFFFSVCHVSYILRNKSSVIIIFV